MDDSADNVVSAGSPGSEPTIPTSDTVAASVNPRATNTNEQVKVKISQCRTVRRDLIANWGVSIDYRRGKPFATDSDQDRVSVNLDWPNTSKKQAQLFSQLPRLRMTAKRGAPPQIKPAVPMFQDKVNEALETSGAADAMFEVIPDVYNAAGIAAVLVSYESRQIEKAMPAAPVRPNPALPPGTIPPPQPPTVALPYTSAKRFICERLSPGDLLWDVSFAGSNFNKSPLTGRSGRYKWAEALRNLGKSKDRPNGLTDADRQLVCGTDTRTNQDMLTHGDEHDRFKDEQVVAFDEVWYYRFYYDPEEASFEAIQHVVFVRGRGEPVVDELWKGQKRGPNDSILGSSLPAIQFLTLDYVTDEPIPESTSAIARPQVDELMESRTQQLLQRRFSIPMRWFDNNRVPPELVTVLMRGQWQGAIPLDGPGDRALGETARSSYPHENDVFDRIARADADSVYNTASAIGGGGAVGATQIRSATEARAAQGNFEMGGSLQRARVEGFFARIGQVMAGLVALYGDFNQEEQALLGGLPTAALANHCNYDVRVDSTVLLSAEQRYGRLERFLNISVKSGVVDEIPTLKEMAELSGIDGACVSRPTEQKGPAPINVSMKLNGVEDLDNPVVVAMLMASGQFPGPEALAAAKKAIIQSKSIMDVQLTPPPPPAPEPPPGGPAGMPPIEPGADNRPDWNTASRIEKRSENGK